MQENGTPAKGKLTEAGGRNAASVLGECFEVVDFGATTRCMCRQGKPEGRRRVLRLPKPSEWQKNDKDAQPGRFLIAKKWRNDHEKTVQEGDPPDRG